MKPNLIFGAVVAAIGYSLGAGSAACAKMLGSEVSPFTILFFQNAIALCFTIPDIAKEGLRSLKTQRIGLHLLRSSSGLVCFLLFYDSLRYISLVNGVLLLNAFPLWIPFIAMVYPGVRMRGHTWWGILVGFLGIIFILKPGVDGFSGGTWVALASGFFGGCVTIFIRRLSHTESAHQILFYNFLFATLATAPFFFFSDARLNPIQFLYLLGVGIFIYLGQALATHAFRHGKAAVLGPMTYITIVASAILGWILWDEVPDAVAFLGIALVIVGGIFSIYFERRYEKQIETKR